MKTKIVFSKKCLEFSYHNFIPDNSDRIENAYNFLKKLEYDFIDPEPAEESTLLTVHSKEYIDAIKNGCFEDDDTPAWEGIYEYARLAAGAAIKAAEINGFSLMRPPDHHAGRNGLALDADSRGFCYFNNISIAAARAGL